MSSDMFVVDQEPYHLLHTQNITPQATMINNMYDSESQFLCYPFSTDSSIDSILLQDISSVIVDEPPPPNSISNCNPLPPQISISSCSVDDQSSNLTSSNFFSNSSNSNSPPSIQLGTLSIRQQQQQHEQQVNLANNSSGFQHGFLSGDYSHHEMRKTEKTSSLQVQGFDYPNFNNSSSNPSSWFQLGGDESQSSNAAIMRFLQRSFSYGGHNSASRRSNYSSGVQMDENRQPSSSSMFSPNFNPILDSGIHVEGSSPPDSGGFSDTNMLSGQIRRVFSTGDLSKTKCAGEGQTAAAVCSSSLRIDRTTSSYMEEAAAAATGNFKVGKYSAEERRDKIDRYRAKRSQRNFNKTIKYACRKTLADNRPRIRGRFARNDESGDLVSKPMSYSYDQEEDEQLWVDGLNGEDEESGRVVVGDGRSERVMFTAFGTAGNDHPQQFYHQYYNCGC